MRVGLVSDTHVQDDLKGMPPEICEVFRRYGVELILHAGDIDSPRVLDVLEQVAPVLAVRDFTEPSRGDPRLEETYRVTEVEGKKIGLVHDISWPGARVNADDGLQFPDMPLTEVLTSKFGQAVDIVVYGHTHEELVLIRDGVWFVNPGSTAAPGLRHRLGELGTIGILEISPEGSISVEIVKLGT